VERIALVGTGRLARALARTFRERMSAVVGRSPSAVSSVAEITPQAAALSLDDIERASFDIVWIATSDSAIEEVARRLAATARAWNGITVIHSSGALGVGALRALEEKGARVLALHPNASLRGDEPISDATIWGVTPDDAGSVDAARHVLRPLEARLLPIAEDHRALYHAAASAASNLSVTLFMMAELLYEHAGIERPLARELVAAFMATSVERARVDGPEATITGPVVRGDADVVDAQRRAVAATLPGAAGAFDTLVSLTASLFAVDRIEPRP
jgi:predicted short-subunit dehydrogenase-like oxidoreductase (DUF2520 family)